MVALLHCCQLMFQSFCSQRTFLASLVLLWTRLIISQRFYINLVNFPPQKFHKNQHHVMLLAMRLQFQTPWKYKRKRNLIRSNFGTFLEHLNIVIFSFNVLLQNNKQVSKSFAATLKEFGLQTNMLYFLCKHFCVGRIIKKNIKTHIYMQDDFHSIKIIFHNCLTPWGLLDIHCF